MEVEEGGMAAVAGVEDGTAVGVEGGTEAVTGDTAGIGLRSASASVVTTRPTTAIQLIPTTLTLTILLTRLDMLLLRLPHQLPLRLLDTRLLRLADIPLRWPIKGMLLVWHNPTGPAFRPQ